MASRSFFSLLASLRFGILSHRREIGVPDTVFNRRILRIFWRLGYIHGFQRRGQKLLVAPVYAEHGRSPVLAMQPVSTPGRRLRTSYASIVRSYGQCPFVLLSTSQGLCTLRDLRQLGSRLGGEVICVQRGLVFTLTMQFPMSTNLLSNPHALWHWRPRTNQLPRNLPWLVRTGFCQVGWRQPGPLGGRLRVFSMPGALFLPRGILASLRAVGAFRSQLSAQLRHYQGWYEELIIRGIGYKYRFFRHHRRNYLSFRLGYSHRILFPLRWDYTFAANKRYDFLVTSRHAKHFRWTVEALRNLRPSDPYKGKGFKYDSAPLVLKVGKVR